MTTDQAQATYEATAVRTRAARLAAAANRDKIDSLASKLTELRTRQIALDHEADRAQEVEARVWAELTGEQYT